MCLCFAVCWCRFFLMQCFYPFVILNIHFICRLFLFFCSSVHIIHIIQFSCDFFFFSMFYFHKQDENTFYDVFLNVKTYCINRVKKTAINYCIMYLLCLLFSILCLKSWPLNVANLNNPVNSCLWLHPTHAPFLAHLFFTAVWTSILSTALPRPPSPPAILRSPSWPTNGRVRWRTSWTTRLSWTTLAQTLGPRKALTSSAMGRTPSMTVPHGSSWWAGWWWPLLGGKPEKWGLEREWMMKRNGDSCVAQCAAVNDLKII